MSHAARAELAPYHPVHVTIKLCRGLPSLRRKRTVRVLERAFAAGKDRFGFRLTQYSVQSSHVHLIVEVDDRHAMSRGMKGLCGRIAKAVNELWRRRGRVFADRYHEHVLRTPREVRNALRYVLQNARRHAVRLPAGEPDPFSSAPFFDGWRDFVARTFARACRPTVVSARTWLARHGWRRHGRIPLTT